MNIDYRKGMEILRTWNIHAPAIVRLYSHVYVFSRMECLGSGKSIEAALTNAELLPVRTDYKREPFVADSSTATVRRAEMAVCTARSATMALRIANALNEYIPGDRKN